MVNDILLCCKRSRRRGTDPVTLTLKRYIPVNGYQWQHWKVSNDLLTILHV